MTLTHTLIESLFEVRRNLYSTARDELAAVARGDKGCAVQHAARQHDIDAFVNQATELGLTVRVQPSRDPAIQALVATRPGEEWRAEVLGWVMDSLRHGSGYGAEYLQSLALGYSREQAEDWIAMRKHLSPVHLQPPIYFLLQRPEAERMSRTGTIQTTRSLTIVALTIFAGGLRRDALTRLPSGYVIGRSAMPRGKLSEFFRFEPLRILIGECAVHRQSRLASLLLCKLDFWNGERWTAEP